MSSVMCMRRSVRRQCVGIVSALVFTAAVLPMPGLAQTKAKTPPPQALPHIKWTDLVLPGWDPVVEARKHMKDQNFAAVGDTDPRMLEILKKMREVWDNAPTNPAMDGVHGRIPGYLVPLEESKQGLKEMLLVPYYGACIHSPPPPANQIIHVFLTKPIKGFGTMDTVWVEGTLKAFRGDSYMGASGYQIKDAQLKPYTKAYPQTGK